MIRRRWALGLIAVALVSACTAPPYRALTEAAPTPSEAVAHETGRFTGEGGTQLFEQRWRPRTGDPRAVLVIHHGLKDHSTRYGAFATRLVGRGFAVYAYDMRGHGHSEGRHAALDSFDALSNDLGTFLESVRAREPGRPVFLLGHSVGGAVVTLHTLERRPNLAGLVVLAPALRINRAPIEAAATPLAAALLPNFGAVETPNEAFSRDPAVVREMDADPLVYQPSGPARTAASLVRALERIWARADTLDVPVYGLHGTVDTLTDPRGTVELVQRARNPDHTLTLYRGLRHDLIHEPEREQVMEDLERWLVARIAPPSADDSAPRPAPAPPPAPATP